MECFLGFAVYLHLWFLFSLLFVNIFTMRLPRTINVQIGKKLSDKTKEEIMWEILKVFTEGVVAVQIGYEIVRVNFDGYDEYRQAKSDTGVYLFDLWCPIMGGWSYGHSGSCL